MAPLTFLGYEHIIHRHLIAALGAIPLSRLRPRELQAYYAEKLERGRLDGKGSLSPRTVPHHDVTIHNALQSAVKWQIITRNPADAMNLPQVERPEMNTFDAVGPRRFLDAAKETPYHVLLYSSLLAGVRRSELLALRWDDVDLGLGQISVSRGLSHLRDGATLFRAPKSKKGRRMVPLPPSATRLLNEHRQVLRVRHVLAGLRQPAGTTLVFTRPNGSPMLPDTVTHACTRLTRRTSFHGTRLHDARHTHATLRLKQGVCI